MEARGVLRTPKTSAPITAPLTPANGASSIQPEFIRLPKVGTLDPRTGLGRSYLNSVILATKANNRKPPVKSICLRQPGAVKGVRLIVYQSLLAYLHSKAQEAA